MVSSFSQLFDIFEQTKSFVAAHPDLKDAFESIANDIEDRRASSKPNIIVYGVYNAGKSTLINALVGTEVAEVGDIPTTATIQDYTWTYEHQDYCLTDTPGIDAPIEHETITRTKLDKADAVIFVVNPVGVADELKTLEQVIKLSAAKKKVLMILNSKEPLPQDEEHNYLPALKDKLLKQMQKLADAQNLKINLLSLQIIAINAFTACAAIRFPKVEKRPILLKMSNIEQCKRAIAMLCQNTQEGEICERLAFRLKSFLEEQLKGCQQEQSKYGFFDEHHYQNLLQLFDQNVEQCKNQVAEAIVQAGCTMYNEVRNILMRSSASDARNEMPALQHALESQVFSVYKKYCIKINRDLENYQVEVAERLGHKDLVINMKDGSELALADANFNLDAGIPPKTDTLIDLKKISPEAIMGTTATITAASKLLLPTLGGLGSLLGKAIPYIGLAVTAYTIFSAFKDRDSEAARINAQIAEQNRQREEAYARFEKQVADEAQSVQYQFEQSLTSFFEEQFETFDKVRELFTTDMQKMGVHNKELNDFSVEVGALLAKLA